MSNRSSIVELFTQCQSLFISISVILKWKLSLTQRHQMLKNGARLGKLALLRAGSLGISSNQKIYALYVVVIHGEDSVYAPFTDLVFVVALCCGLYMLCLVWFVLLFIWW